MKLLNIGSSSIVCQNLKKNETLCLIKFSKVSISESSSLELLESTVFYGVVISFIHIVGSFYRK